jgi:cytochrome c-type biogenesis protein CcmH
MKYLLLIFFLIVNLNSFAAVEIRQFDDPQHEQDYKKLISELRCLVCQNQTIADSNADLAKDLRRQVYEMIQQGKSQQEINDYMLARYGDFVLYRPPLKAKTWLLWAGPVILLFMGLCFLFVYARGRTKEPDLVLTEHQKKKLDQLLKSEDER